ncbi:hypothetical protein QYE76_024839 [Lolium multiflorum]|uniref:Integrase catalytic domain-containing protein n=1 Tax=Lolium multiflorum TaxID=4521 RepID=A0AAD8VTM5_LOLMU|nr:hypothetical protein QYE76_024839 [Lolium multiflorum]
MENYSLIMGAAVMKMAVEMAAVSMEKPSGGTSPFGGVPEQRLLSPRSWLRDGGGSGRFGIPQTITTDGGSVFVSKEFRKFCEDMGIKLIRSSPYYAQANGQAEASNKSLIKLIKRKIDEHPRRWHEAGSRRITFQNDLTAEEYAALMSDNIEDATELRLWSLEKIKENKAKVARAYNKKVRPKEFQVGDLVWEAVLPLGTKDKVYGKWSPNWHGPYKVDQVLKRNAYMLEQLDGVKFPVAVNGQHLKKYFPNIKLQSEFEECLLGYLSDLGFELGLMGV